MASTALPVPPCAGLHQHSRRPPAHKSVSLMHSPRSRTHAVPVRSNSSSDSNQNVEIQQVKRPRVKRSLPSSLHPMGGKDSSGESSNAENWFENSNNKPMEGTVMDNDPPFFLRHSSSSETPPDRRQTHVPQGWQPTAQADSLPLRTGLLQLGTDGSSTEDFRGVIDDLTIENKKLKRRLKKYEKLHDSHLKDEKLFEVRFHRLPPEKKRELEETLRKFASNLTSPPAPGFHVNGYEGLVPALKTSLSKPTSSQASMQNADSAYASMSASAQGSSGQSGSDMRQTPFRPSVKSRHKTIHSYLHHIPEGLLPQQNPATMTERAKKKIVVRRLEQIFAGKGAVGGHHQPLQQQELSQIAAHADRTALEQTGQRTNREGVREAMIMNQETEDPLDPETMTNMARKETSHATSSTTGERDFVNGDEQLGPDQRPTRPLDLDPHRAQVPAENINYIRHLGFSPQDPSFEQSPEEGHGWMYLNLLINMAQLHTLNVTPEFVRKALEEISEKFELSNDRRKVRWRGSPKVTRTSSAGESSYEATEDETVDGQSPRKRLKLQHTDSGRTTVRKQGATGGKSMLSRGALDNVKHVYTPMFFHRDESEDSDKSESEAEDEELSDHWPAPLAGDSSGMTSSGIRTASTKVKKLDDGPIIFYNNARFCTDLSGDRKTGDDQNAPPYNAMSVTPIGKASIATGRQYEARGPLAEAKELPEPMDLNDNPIPESMEVSFPIQDYTQDRRARNVHPVHMEVSGIGGVYPSDNFAIAVESRQVLGKRPGTDCARYGSVKRAPQKMQHLLNKNTGDSRGTPTVHEEITEVKLKHLPSSALPPALSYLPFTDQSYDEDDESDADDAMSDAPESPGALAPTPAPQVLGLPHPTSEYDDEEEEDDDDDLSDDESDGSVDMLAAARQVDPEAIREQEREYDANLAERLAEEIPAGSSAATAGGGSGFASPSSNADPNEHKSARQSIRRAGQRRGRLSDSMVVQGTADDDSESENGGESGNESEMAT